MLILLPPSEGKTPAATGAPFALDELSFPGLNPARKEVLAALAGASSADDALGVLGVGASLLDEVRRNTALDVEPAAPAHTIYSGVLYDALGYHRMTPVQQRRADAAVVIISGLWGAIGFADRVPAYRLSMGVSLPETGRLSSYWKRELSEPLSRRADDELIIDCRSSSYSSAWAAPAHQTAAVNVFQQRHGRRTVVSHFAKHTRGELARHLLTRRGAPPSTPQSLLKAARRHWDAELVEASGRKPYQLNIVLHG
ncbi:YaaA family protein [Arthrobacter castelli]|uniref:YaaA family protein n=1 Tax=Arthrobacter castelli TaxID=271431 RepID=UPI000413B7B3|nr:peroxide stress protein YaaA [Arthrobacter castelli]